MSSSSSLQINVRGGTDLLEVLILVGAILAVVSGIVVFGETIREKFFGAEGAASDIAMRTPAEGGAGEDFSDSSQDGPNDTSADDVVVLGDAEVDAVAAERGEAQGVLREADAPPAYDSRIRVPTGGASAGQSDRVSGEGGTESAASQGAAAVLPSAAGATGGVASASTRQRQADSAPSADAMRRYQDLPTDVDSDGDGTNDYFDPNPYDASIAYQSQCSGAGDSRCPNLPASNVVAGATLAEPVEMSGYDPYSADALALVGAGGGALPNISGMSQTITGGGSGQGGSGQGFRGSDFCQAEPTASGETVTQTSSVGRVHGVGDYNGTINNLAALCNPSYYFGPSQSPADFPALDAEAQDAYTDDVTSLTDEEIEEQQALALNASGAALSEDFDTSWEHYNAIRLYELVMTGGGEPVLEAMTLEERLDYLGISHDAWNNAVPHLAMLYALNLEEMNRRAEARADENGRYSAFTNGVTFVLATAFTAGLAGPIAGGLGAAGVPAGAAGAGGSFFAGTAGSAFSQYATTGEVDWGDAALGGAMNMVGPLELGPVSLSVDTDGVNLGLGFVNASYGFDGEVCGGVRVGSVSTEGCSEGSASVTFAGSAGSATLNHDSENGYGVQVAAPTSFGAVTAGGNQGGDYNASAVVSDTDSTGGPGTSMTTTTQSIAVGVHGNTQENTVGASVGQSTQTLNANGSNQVSGYQIAADGNLDTGAATLAGSFNSGNRPAGPGQSTAAALAGQVDLDDEGGVAIEGSVELTQTEGNTSQTTLVGGNVNAGTGAAGIYGNLTTDVRGEDGAPNQSSSTLVGIEHGEDGDTGLNVGLTQSSGDDVVTTELHANTNGDFGSGYSAGGVALGFAQQGGEGHVTLGYRPAGSPLSVNGQIGEGGVYEGEIRYVAEDEDGTRNIVRMAFDETGLTEYGITNRVVDWSDCEGEGPERVCTTIEYTIAVGATGELEASFVFVDEDGNRVTGDIEGNVTLTNAEGDRLVFEDGRLVQIIEANSEGRLIIDISDSGYAVHVQGNYAAGIEQDGGGAEAGAPLQGGGAGDEELGQVPAEAAPEELRGRYERAMGRLMPGSDLAATRTPDEAEILELEIYVEMLDAGQELSTMQQASVEDILHHAELSQLTSQPLEFSIAYERVADALELLGYDQVAIEILRFDIEISQMQLMELELYASIAAGENNTPGSGIIARQTAHELLADIGIDAMRDDDGDGIINAEDAHENSEFYPASAQGLFTFVGGATPENSSAITAQIMRFPDGLVQNLKDAEVRIVVTPNSVADSPEFMSANGSQGPRGWPPGASWQDVTGVHDSESNTIFVSQRSLAHGPFTVLHEIGHSVNHHFVNGEAQRSFEAAYQADLAELGDMSGYYVQGHGAGLSETFATFFAYYYMPELRAEHSIDEGAFANLTAWFEDNAHLWES